MFKQSGEKLPDSWTKLHQKYVLPKLSHYSFKTYGKYKIFTKLGDLPVQIKESLEKLSKLAFYELHKNTLNLSFPKTNLKSHSTVVILYQWITLLQVKNVTYLFKKECNKNFSFFYIKVFKNLLQPGTWQKRVEDQKLMAMNYWRINITIVFWYSMLETLLSVLKQEFFLKVFINIVTWLCLDSS